MFYDVKSTDDMEDAEALYKNVIYSLILNVRLS